MCYKRIRTSINNVDTPPFAGYRDNANSTKERIVRVIVKKWGNSASVRIPAGIMEAARLDLDDPVDVREEGGRIVIEPLRSKEFNLAQMLDAITPDNLHAEIYFGAPAGREHL
jgi:antitoxin MazE